MADELINLIIFITKVGRYFESIRWIIEQHLIQKYGLSDRWLSIV